MCDSDIPEQQEDLVDLAASLRGSRLSEAPETDAKRCQFGNRYLSNELEVFTQNAWDDVPWNEEREQQAKAAVQLNSAQKMPDALRAEYQSEPAKYWDTFYNTHNDRFFKDRLWLFTEFPELAPYERSNETDEGACRILDLGCGVGNTLLPLLKYNTEPNLLVYACDFSQRAVDMLEANAMRDKQRSVVFQLDAACEQWQVPFEEGTLDIIVLIFVLSAIEPAKMKHVIANSWRYLRPGGVILFRDYGRYDMAQLRFKSGKCLSDNLYVRGDGTMVYFFEQDEVRQLFKSAGFVEEQNIVDRRLQVNRGRMLKMYRVWLQAKYRKPLEAPK